ncbi:hypothetical protein KKD84_00465 [Patescibacteria group bacterium]|nr:hypothetical protein [Patescibacteria group bacterium]
MPTSKRKTAITVRNFFCGIFFNTRWAIFAPKNEAGINIIKPHGKSNKRTGTIMVEVPNPVSVPMALAMMVRKAM